MAQELRQACATNYPEDFEGRLDIPGHVTCCAFNSYGAVVAFGTNDGRIFLYDIAASQIMRQFSGHFYPVTCLSWSRTNRLLLSSGADYQLICWNVYGDELDDALFTIDCLNSSPIINVQFHPRDERYFLVDRMFHASQLGRYSPSTHKAELTNLMPVRTRVRKQPTTTGGVPSSTMHAADRDHYRQHNDNQHRSDHHRANGNGDGSRDFRRSRTSPPPPALLPAPLTDAEIEEHWATRALFDRSGKHIYCSSDEGLVFVLKFVGDNNKQSTTTAATTSGSGGLGSSSKQLVASFRVYNNKGGVVPILQLALSKSRGHLALNCQDRTIRVFAIEKVLKAGIDRKCGPLESFKPHSEYYDQVSRRPWNNVIFSAGGEFICAAADDTHQINIWEIESMSLVKTLTPHGRKGNEVLADMQWHPLQPRLLSVANGYAFLWGHRYAEEWSAWNYKFTDLDENQDFEEREGEFDAEDEDAPQTPAATKKPLLSTPTSPRKFKSSLSSRNLSYSHDDEIIDVVSDADMESRDDGGVVSMLNDAAENTQIIVPLLNSDLPVLASTAASAGGDDAGGSSNNTSFDSGGNDGVAANMASVPADTIDTDLALLAIYKGEVPQGLFVNPLALSPNKSSSKTRKTINTTPESVKNAAAAASAAAARQVKKKPTTTSAGVSASTTPASSQQQTKNVKKSAKTAPNVSAGASSNKQQPTAKTKSISSKLSSDQQKQAKKRGVGFEESAASSIASDTSSSVAVNKPYTGGKILSPATLFNHQPPIISSGGVDGKNRQSASPPPPLLRMMDEHQPSPGTPPYEPPAVVLMRQEQPQQQQQPVVAMASQQQHSELVFPTTTTMPPKKRIDVWHSSDEDDDGTLSDTSTSATDSSSMDTDDE